MQQCCYRVQSCSSVQADLKYDNFLLTCNKVTKGATFSRNNLNMLHEIVLNSLPPRLFVTQIK